MKVIDLLNKIANWEEVPKKIKYKGIVREFDYEDKDYICKGYEDYYLFHDTLAEGTGDKMVTALNDEVKIIEDTPKEYINVSEEQVLFNDLSYEEQQFILKQMRILNKMNGEENE